MAKQMPNANISSSSRADINVDYVYKRTVEVWSSMNADICNFAWWLILVKFNGHSGPQVYLLFNIPLHAARRAMAAVVGFYK